VVSEAQVAAEEDGKEAHIMRSIPLFLLLLPAMTVSCGSQEEAPGQKAFSSPEDAVVALVQAARTDNKAEITAIFGPDAQKVLASGDPVMDRRSVEVFLAAYEERAQLTNENDKRTLLIGNEEWPFPIPLVKENWKWRFDTAAGVKEVLFRRIGRNELSTITACRTFVEAQKEYAKKPHDGKPAGAYAQKFASTPGKQDGLYWKNEESQEPSPLGELAAQAAAEGYRRSGDQPVPFHGYYFRMLTAQGKNADGGARNYLKDGEMREGFSLIALPAEYGSSGIVTFIVNQDGIVREKDLGPNTAQIAAQITKFDPDSSWDTAH